MSTPAAFRIYNASAGAGKTYSLVRNYLLLCLKEDDPAAFRQILAITFTNKAAQEMKQRLVRQLSALRHFPPTDSEIERYGEELAAELGITPEKLAKRARHALKKILHSYSSFAVSTIDSFTNKLIRSFSRDLNLSSHYQVELENQVMLDEAIDQLLAKLEVNSPTTQLLTRFIEKQLAQDRSPNSRAVLSEVAQQLFAEEAQSYLLELKDLELADYLQAEKVLRHSSEGFRQKMREQATALLAWCAEQGIHKDCFSGGYFWNQLHKQAAGEVRFFSDTVLAAIAGEKDFHAKTKAKEAMSLLAVEDRFRQKCQAHLDFWYSQFPRYFLCDLVLQKLYGLAVLSEIDTSLQIVKAETQRLPIGEFNKIISQNLREQPAPFLYEKLGERYRHFFVDEFQDTSTLQWQNLLPLINNSLAGENSSAMIVGDAKQSIYRFRGGEVQLFIDLYEDRDRSNYSEDRQLYPRSVVNLPNNWRSRSEIVEFNNQFFNHAANILPDEAHRKIYRDGAQNAKAQDGGLVRIHFSDSSGAEFIETQCQLALNTLKECLQRGFRQSEIGVLTPKNKEGQILARFLLENEAQHQLPPGEQLRVVSVDS